jgi:lysophospholipase L1-like esterase
MWGEGNLLITGDSNATGLGYYAKRILHPDCFTAGVPGNVPMHEYDNPAVEGEKIDTARTRHKTNPIRKVYIQTGGNMWTWHPIQSLDLNITPFQNDMRKVIQDWKEIIDQDDIVIANLPWVDPSMKLGDMGTGKELPKDLKRIKIVDIFAVANGKLAATCAEEGVKHLDIYTRLALLWKQHDKSWWWDRVHYAKKAHIVIAQAIKASWEM